MDLNERKVKKVDSKHKVHAACSYSRNFKLKKKKKLSNKHFKEEGEHKANKYRKAFAFV